MTLSLAPANLLSKQAQLQKRVIDLVFSALGLALLAPFLGLVALAIRLDSAGPVLYRQPRLGRGGKVFWMLKFRTMRVDADVELRESLLRDPALRAEYAEYQKLSNDPRITRCGRLIRRLSIDELPQLWNVLQGSMSLVGPRPLLMDQVALYTELIADYQSVAPGITGLWQISGRNLTNFQTRKELDREYFKRWSLWLDLKILAGTVGAVLRCVGAR